MQSATALPIENYRVWLIEEWGKRREKNPSYSLKAFSKALGVSAPSLSQVLSGKRPLSRKAALRIIHHCSLSPEDAKNFLASALGVQNPAIDFRSPAKNSYSELDEDAFRIISDWKHYAILSLGDLPDNRATSQWIANQLAITEKEASEAFDRLLRMGLVKRRGSRFRQSSKPLTAPTGRSTAALRKYHSQNLTKASKALEREETDVEYFSAITMALDESKLPQAREFIKNFRRQLCEFLEMGRRERVYTLAIQLFPISKKGNAS
jgi:uncharacterized protein (TIGR02147 family)